MTLVRAAVLAAVCFAFFKFVLLPARVEGISMLPTCRNHSVAFVNRLAYLWHPPRRGDVVAVRLAGIHVMYLKRIIGLPGETVAFKKGRVLINGSPLDEPYEKLGCTWTLPPIHLGSNQFFVVGDNRSMPPGEHKFGAVKRRRIVGRAVL